MKARHTPGGRPWTGGFIMIEVTVVYLITAIVVVSLASVFLLAAKAGRTSEETLRASQLSAELLEEVLLRKWDEKQPSARPAYPAYSKSTLGVDAGETSGTKTTFDDIDDFSSYSESPPKDPVGRSLSGFSGWTRSITVQYVTSTMGVTAAGTDYKLITVCATKSSITRACLKRLVTNL